MRSAGDGERSDALGLPQHIAFPRTGAFRRARRLRQGGYKAHGDGDLDVVERAPGVRGFAVLPKRRVVERTFGWLSRDRRINKDDERKVQTSETLIAVAMSRLAMSRLGRQAKHAV